MSFLSVADQFSLGHKSLKDSKLATSTLVTCFLSLQTCYLTTGLSLLTWVTLEGCLGCASAALSCEPQLVVLLPVCWWWGRGWWWRSVGRAERDGADSGAAEKRKYFTLYVLTFFENFLTSYLHSLVHPHWAKHLVFHLPAEYCSLLTVLICHSPQGLERITCCCHLPVPTEGILVILSVLKQDNLLLPPPLCPCTA